MSSLVADGDCKSPESEARLHHGSERVCNPRVPSVAERGLQIPWEREEVWSIIPVQWRFFLYATQVKKIKFDHDNRE